ncbi:hypothetical protein Barb4_05123 [Bacteroidales bacterium Barb4]|nr:hypothetical protein Barb4_05123 [Bacteroidales bacterium Barb4]
MRTQRYVPLHRKHIGIVAGNAVAREVCPLQQTPALLAGYLYPYLRTGRIPAGARADLTLLVRLQHHVALVRVRHTLRMKDCAPRAVCRIELIGVVHGNHLARCVCPHHKMIALAGVNLCLYRLPVAIGAFARYYLAVRGGQVHHIAFRKMRPDCHVSFHNKLIGIVDRKERLAPVARPLLKVIARIGGRLHLHRCIIRKFIVHLPPGGGEGEHLRYPAVSAGDCLHRTYVRFKHRLVGHIPAHAKREWIPGHPLKRLTPVHKQPFARDLPAYKATMFSRSGRQFHHTVVVRIPVGQRAVVLTRDHPGDRIPPFRMIRGDRVKLIRIRLDENAPPININVVIPIQPIFFITTLYMGSTVRMYPIEGATVNEKMLRVRRRRPRKINVV